MEISLTVIGIATVIFSLLLFFSLLLLLICCVLAWVSKSLLTQNRSLSNEVVNFTIYKEVEEIYNRSLELQEHLGVFSINEEYKGDIMVENLAKHVNEYIRFLESNQEFYEENK